MDEQMIRELALAIQRADDEKAPDSPLFPDDPEISDWGIHLARAAHSVIAGKVAEQRDAVRDALRAAYIAGATDVHIYWRAGGDDTEPDFAEAGSDYADDKIAALAPYPERR